MTDTYTQWIADPITDADGFVTIRPADGSDNGDINAQPIATVYSGGDDALVIAAAPELLEACQDCVDALRLTGRIGTKARSDTNRPKWANKMIAAIAKATATT